MNKFKPFEKTDLGTITIVASKLSEDFGKEQISFDVEFKSQKDYGSLFFMI